MLSCSPLVICWLALALPGDELVDASFEQRVELEGWSTMIGATNGGEDPLSRIDVVRKDARDGRACLRLRGDASTRGWSVVYQELDARPTDRVTLTVAARCEDVRREGDQFFNANGLIVFLDENGESLGLFGTPQISGDREWTDLAAHAIAPARTARVRIGLFLSMSGTMWFDDVRVRIEPTEPWSKRVAKSTADALELHLRRSYPFFGVADKPLPEELFREHRKKLERAEDAGGFARAAQKMLEELDDLHVSIQTPTERLYTVRGNPHPTNWNYDAVRAAFAEVVAEEEDFWVARLAAGPGYALVRSLSMSAEELDRLDAALDALADAPSLVLDLRPNGGGDELQARRIAGRFASARTEYARSRYRDWSRPEHDAFGDDLPRYLEPREGREPDRRAVAVLTGRFAVSSAEGLLLMLKALPTATLVGLPSRGASGNPGGFEYLPGYTLYASRWQSLELDGTCIEGVGVEPDVRVEERPSEYRDADPTFERAVALLTSD